MIKLVIFDWNGTLLADTKLVWQSDNHLISTYGGQKIDFKTYLDSDNSSAIDFYLAQGCKKTKLLEDLTQAGITQNSFYENHAYNCRTRKGTKKVLQWLQNNKTPIIILSNHTLNGIHTQLKRLKLESYFSHIFAHAQPSGFLYSTNKTNKLKHYLKKNNLKPHQIIIVGDSPVEIKTGKNLGLTSISITNGCHSKKILIERKPDYLITNLAECIDIFKKS